jgi:nicotinamidase/pyrazinamidase
MNKTDCLVVVDVQNDFCPGGALAVPEGDEIVSPINELMGYFPLVASTQDWHPKDHCSFKMQGGPWPPHCVQNTKGAEFHPRLDSKKIALKIHKGANRDKDAYSGFEGTAFNEELKKRGVERVYIVGLATDYCVKQTALDAVLNDFQTVVFTDLIRAINARPGDDQRALEAIQNVGGTLLLSTEIKNL